VVQFPLPENWDSPLNYWDGWTHLLHTNDQNEAETAFEFIASSVKVNGYPMDPKQLTREIVTHLKIDLKQMRRSERIFKFPWLDPKLNYNPLTQATLVDHTESVSIRIKPPVLSRS